MNTNAPVWYLIFDAAGDVASGGYSPDGTVPAGATVCTQEQAQSPHDWRLADGAIVAVPGNGKLIAYANERQWSLATAGYTVTIGGQRLQFATDPQSQALIAGKAQRFAQQPPLASVDWQFGGQFVTIAAADFVAAAVQVADFVQATFDALRIVLTGIEAGTIATPAEIDAAAWPSNIAA